MVLRLNIIILKIQRRHGGRLGYRVKNTIKIVIQTGGRANQPDSQKFKLNHFATARKDHNLEVGLFCCLYFLTRGVV